jgi:pantoate--beta-alanine ligase
MAPPMSRDESDTRGPEVISEPGELRARCDAARRAGHTVGLVPTMGALHEGHLALVDEARAHASFVVVTIFVNPTQFGPNEDFARYPRTLARDVERLAERGVDLVLAPEVSAMYPPGDETRVRVGDTASPLCGAHRPGHFEGVATVVTKLFSLVGPSTAVFGRKDFQQVRVIERVVADLFLPVRVVALPTVREADGLALSSRNAYLSPEARARALAVPRALARAAALYGEGERRAGPLRAAARAELEPAVDSIDYCDLADAGTLAVQPDDATLPPRTLLAVAVRLAGVRLIDNLVLGEDRAPIV